MATGCQGGTSTTQQLQEQPGDEQQTIHPQTADVRSIPFSSLFCIGEDLNTESSSQTNDSQTPAVTGRLYKCEKCGKPCKSETGRKIHLNFCKRNKEAPAMPKTAGAQLTSEPSQDMTSQISQILYEPKVWGNHTLNDIDQIASAIFNEISSWRKNLFNIPSGAAGKKFVEEATRLINLWNDKTPIANVALKLLSILPSLMLQKPSKNSKSREHVKHLEKRLNLWKEGDFDSLTRECRLLQSKLSKTASDRTKSLSKRFSDLMFQGKVNAALKLLSNTTSSGIAPINDETLKALQEKHPMGQPKLNELLLEGPVDKIDPILFEAIDEELIQRMASKTKGSSGPSKLDAQMWQRMLLSKSFGDRSNDLCKAIAKMTRIMCTETCSKETGRDMEAFLSCTLIPLDKNPGIRPIGIGEVLRRIVGKTVTAFLKNEIQQAAGNLQLCVGQMGGCEAAVHAMADIFDDEETEAVLLVDASNAFNSINRNVMLHNITILCPYLATFVNNCYSSHIRLFAIGGIEISSSEGTTQGDPIAMALYGICLIPMTKNLETIPDTKQVAYADDITGAGKLLGLRKWWDELRSFGPEIGYFPEPTKSWLIVKPDLHSIAADIFEGTSIKITVKGHKHLGAAIGQSSHKNEFITKKVQSWVSELKVLSNIAATQPQAAYVAFIVGYRQKFNYTMRTINNIAELLQPVEETIRYRLIPALFDGRHCSDLERRILSLPVKMGGLGIINIQEEASFQYQTSRAMTKELCQRIKLQSEEAIDVQLGKNVLNALSRRRLAEHRNSLETIKQDLHPFNRKALEIASSQGASSWLTTLPLKDENYTLNKQEFVDAIHMRYGWNMKRLPAKCACTANFSIDHALSCHLGGYVIQRHNNIRDTLATMMREVCHDVSTEPQLIDVSEESVDLPRSTITGNEARADISARGFWQRYQRAFFDVKVCNLLAPSYRAKSINTSLSAQEKRKKSAYNQRILEVERGTFTPLVFGATGGVAREGSIFLSKLAEKIALKQKCDKSHIISGIRRKISFVLIRSVVACLRGERASRTFTPEQVALKDQKLNEVLSSFTSVDY